MRWREGGRGEGGRGEGRRGEGGRGEERGRGRGREGEAGRGAGGEKERGGEGGREREREREYETYSWIRFEDIGHLHPEIDEVLNGCGALAYSPSETTSVVVGIEEHVSRGVSERNEESDGMER